MEDTRSFEEKQAALEAIVKQLEAGNTSLEEMLALYEKGEALYRDCAETLDRYEQRLNAQREDVEP